MRTAFLLAESPTCMFSCARSPHNHVQQGLLLEEKSLAGSSHKVVLSVEVQLSLTVKIKGYLKFLG